MKRLLTTYCALTLFGIAATTHAAEYCQPGYPADIARNQYVPGVPCGDAGAIGASLYVSPRPVPPMVGHTFITYEGLMPDQLLYQHQRTYYRPHGPYGGVTQTKINWGYKSHLNPFGHYHEWPAPFAGFRLRPKPERQLHHLLKHGTAVGSADCYSTSHESSCPSGNCGVQQASIQTVPAQR